MLCVYACGSERVYYLYIIYKLHNFAIIINKNAGDMKLRSALYVVRESNQSDVF